MDEAAARAARARAVGRSSSRSARPRRSAPSASRAASREIAAAGVRPDVIVHALVVGRHAGGAHRRLRAASGCRRASSASAPTIRRRSLAADRRESARRRSPTRSARSRRRSAPIATIDVDDSQVGDGYGMPTPASTAKRIELRRAHAKASCSIRSTRPRPWPDSIARDRAPATIHAASRPCCSGTPAGSA